MVKNRGFIQILGPILALIAILGGGYIYYQQNYAKSPVVPAPITDAPANTGNSNENSFGTSYKPRPVTPVSINDQTQVTPPVTNQPSISQIPKNEMGAIISFAVNPCRQEQYSCVYSYGAKAVLLGKNLTSATMKSSGSSGSGAVPFDGVIGNMKKVSESVNGDRWEGTVQTGLWGTDNFYIEAKDLQGNILKSDKLHLQYESASNLTIISPQRNEELQRGTSKEIKWSISNPPKNSWIRIDIAKVPESGQSLSLQEAQVLVKMVPSDSSFVWNIPSNLEARRYEMRVDLYGDESDFNTFVVRSITDFVVK